LAVPSGVQNISAIEASLANAQTAMASAKSQHQTTSNTVNSLLQSIEGVNTTEIGAQILSLQTALSASLETTARLSQINLLSYLSPVSG
jgi:flagellar hook-associated protein 3 FlgL